MRKYMHIPSQNLAEMIMFSPSKQNLLDLYDTEEDMIAAIASEKALGISHNGSVIALVHLNDDGECTGISQMNKDYSDFIFRDAEQVKSEFAKQHHHAEKTETAYVLGFDHLFTSPGQTLDSATVVPVSVSPNMTMREIGYLGAKKILDAAPTKNAINVIFTIRLGASPASNPAQHRSAIRQKMTGALESFRNNRAGISTEDFMSSILHHIDTLETTESSPEAVIMDAFSQSIENDQPFITVFEDKAHDLREKGITPFIDPDLMTIRTFTPGHFDILTYDLALQAI